VNKKNEKQEHVSSVRGDFFSFDRQKEVNQEFDTVKNSHFQQMSLVQK